MRLDDGCSRASFVPLADRGPVTRLRLIDRRRRDHICCWLHASRLRDPQQGRHEAAPRGLEHSICREDPGPHARGRRAVPEPSFCHGEQPSCMTGRVDSMMMTMMMSAGVAAAASSDNSDETLGSPSHCTHCLHRRRLQLPA